MTDMSGLDPKAEFYMPVTIDNADGSIDLGAEGREAFTSLEGAIADASSNVEDHGGVVVIYRCTPIKRISAYRVKIEDVQPLAPTSDDRSVGRTDSEIA